MTSKMTAGVRETMRMLEKNLLDEVLIARDSDFYVTRPVIEAAGIRHIRLTYIDTKKSLGHICGIPNGAAVAGKLRQDRK